MSMGCLMSQEASVCTQSSVMYLPAFYCLILYHDDENQQLNTLGDQTCIFFCVSWEKKVSKQNF